MSISENLKDVNDRIIRAAQKSGRSPSEIKLICVTKNIPPKRINEAISLGIADIGESRVQEAEKKYTDDFLIKKRINWHLIGHLQTNKVKKAIAIFDLIQSVDTLRLAQEIDKQSRIINKTQECLLEVKISEEESKYGCSPQDLTKLIEQIGELKNIRILGLMTMAPFFENFQLSRPYFRQAKEIYDRFYSHFLTSIRSAHYTLTPILSMGMSNDFEVAIEEGSNMVRIGTAIFEKTEKT